MTESVKLGIVLEESWSTSHLDTLRDLNSFLDRAISKTFSKCTSDPHPPLPFRLLLRVSLQNWSFGMVQVGMVGGVKFGSGEEYSPKSQAGLNTVLNLIPPQRKYKRLFL